MFSSTDNKVTKNDKFTTRLVSTIDKNTLQTLLNKFAASQKIKVRGSDVSAVDFTQKSVLNITQEVLNKNKQYTDLMNKIDRENKENKENKNKGLGDLVDSINPLNMFKNIGKIGMIIIGSIGGIIAIIIIIFIIKSLLSNNNKNNNMQQLNYSYK